MPQLPSDQFYIFSEETDTESAISEQLAQKFGSAINYLNDLIKNRVIYTGSTTVTIPEGVNHIYIFGAGGGGGGAGGNGGGTLAGGGGAGAVPQLFYMEVNPLDQYTLTIGAGGSGGSVNNPGGAGGNSSFIHTVTGVGPQFRGAKGGILSASVFSGGDGLNYDIASSAILLPNSANNFPKFNISNFFTYGGGGNNTNGGSGQAGQSSPYAAGGSGGSGSDHGGGGGAGYGQGGNGSSTSSGTATSGGRSAGGGGGGGAKSGAAGGSGIIIIAY